MSNPVPGPEEAEKTGGYALAPRYPVPEAELVAIEHPFIVKSVDKAIQSLGGAKPVARLVASDKKDVPARLSLHPTDPLARTIDSGIVTGDNLLLKIEVPKRTGRRRKRGSTEPFRNYYGPSVSEPRTQLANAQDALSSLKDNAGKCKITVLGRITRTHRFRDPPDFVWSEQPNGFVSRFRNTILSSDIAKIRDFRLDPNAPGHEMLPPPSLAPSVTPWNYSYRQNSAVKTVELDGKNVTFNSSVIDRLKIPSIRADAEEVPDPSEEVLKASWEKLKKDDKSLVNMAKELFIQRPIWTRRSLHGMLRGKGVNLVQIEHHIYAYVAYTFVSGPWRDALVRYGVDPRKDPTLRIYQTLALRTDDMASMGAKVRKGPREQGSSRTAETSNQQHHKDLTDFLRPPPEEAHIFDGHRIDIRGKVWQLCDISDPLISSMAATEVIRTSCDLEDGGWYHNGTWGKIRAITKAKIRHLLEHGTPLQDDQGYVRILQRLPDQITKENYNKLITRVGKAMLPARERRDLEILRTAMRTMIRAKQSSLAPEKAGPTGDKEQGWVDGDGDLVMADQADGTVDQERDDGESSTDEERGMIEELVESDRDGEEDDNGEDDEDNEGDADDRRTRGPSGNERDREASNLEPHVRLLG